MSHTITVDSPEKKTMVIQPGGMKALFYSNSAAESKCIGHLRFDVDNSGKLWTSWWPHGAAQSHNRQPFKDEFDGIVNALQRDLFSKQDEIQKRMIDREIPIINSDLCYYGFHIDTDAYSYYFRVTPRPHDYSYCYCYVGKGRELL